MVGASPGRGDNGTGTSLNNSCSRSQALADYMRVFIRKKRREKRFESNRVFLSSEDSASPACCGFHQSLSPHPRSPEREDKWDKERHCHRLAGADTLHLGRSGLPGFILSLDVPKRLRPGLSMGALDVFM